MKDRQGFIYIFLVIIMFVCVSLTMHTLFLAYYETLILSSTRRGNQSFYNSESKILMCVNDDLYLKEKMIPILQDVFRNRHFEARKVIRMNREDLSEGDTESKVYITFRDKEKRKIIRLNCKSFERGVVSETTAMGTVVNELFEIQKPLIDILAIEPEYREKGEKLLEQIEGNISVDSSNKEDIVYGFETDDYDRIILMPDKLICNIDNLGNNYRERINRRIVFIVGKKHRRENIELKIRKSDESDQNRLSGIIYIEGDIKIENDFDFNGIIIVNEGEILLEQGSKLNLNGMVIYCNNENPIELGENFNLNYSLGQVQRYGNYLPGFFDIDLDRIKSK